jgi:hypothetical protein
VTSLQSARAVTLGCLGGLLGEGIKRGSVDQFKKDSFPITHWKLELGRRAVYGFYF